jgi:D-amino-acid dehydrogenase
MRLIIVGAGITGAACAYTASGLGAQVILIDAERPGRATAAGAGIICPWTAPWTTRPGTTSPGPPRANTPR